MSNPSSALDRLEQLVAQASSRLRELHEENTGLRERVATLEREAEERVAADGAAQALERERSELVGRVERLVGGLDELLAAVEVGAEG